MPVDSGPTSVAFSPTGDQAYVTTTGDNKVSVITVATGAVGTQISLTGITRPAIVAFRPNGDRAYVANYGSGTVSVISEPVG